MRLPQPLPAKEFTQPSYRTEVPTSPDAVEEEEGEPAGDEAAHDEAQDERRPPLLLPRHALPLTLALLRRRRHRSPGPGPRPGGGRPAVVLAAPATALESVQL